MTGVEASAVITSASPQLSAVDPASRTELTTPVKSTDFADMIANGLKSGSEQINQANALTKQYVTDPESVSIHEVIISLEKARLSVDVMMQVRTRVLEGYRELMNLQL